MRVLIVDDSMLARMMMRKAVVAARPDAEIAEAADGPSALSLATDTVFDIGFIDYNMPGMNGIELGRFLRFRYPETVLVLVTANIQTFVLEEARGIGMECIAKPITDDKIQAYLPTEGGPA